jgi:hypothetical protein
VLVKRSWGRLGAAIGAVALLAGGLAGVAAPVQAGELSDTSGFEKCWTDNGHNGKYGELMDSFGHEFPQRCPDGSSYVGWTRSKSEVYSGYFDYVAWAKQSTGRGELADEAENDEETSEVVQTPPPPPPCWDATISNCPVGGALRFTAPKYAMVGMPVTMYAYASWRPDANSPAQPTNGTAVIRVDGEDYSGVEFKDGVAEWRFIPETEGVKEFTASGVLFSGLSGANAYIDTVEARTYVLEYDPDAYAQALKKKRVEVGETYVITDPNQARSYLKDRYEWSVSEKSDDVCAVYETKKGAVKAKFNGEGKCTVIWMDKESADEGKYTFIAKK